jgi:hypothetical protein
MIFIVKAVENIGHIGDLYPIHPSDCLCVPENSTVVDEFGASLEFTPLNRTNSSAEHEVTYPCEVKHAGEVLLRGRLSTVDLLVLTSLDWHVLMLKMLFSFFTKQATLMKNFFVRDLKIFVQSESVCPWKMFLA